MNDAFECEMQTLKEYVEQKDAENEQLNEAYQLKEQELAEMQEQLADQAKKLKEMQGNLEGVIEQKQAEFDSLVSVNKDMQE